MSETYPHEIATKWFWDHIIACCGAGLIWCSGGWFSGWTSGLATDGALWASIILIPLGLSVIILGERYANRGEE